MPLLRQVNPEGTRMRLHQRKSEGHIPSQEGTGKLLAGTSERLCDKYCAVDHRSVMLCSTCWISQHGYYRALVPWSDSLVAHDCRLNNRRGKLPPQHVICGVLPVEFTLLRTPA